MFSPIVEYILSIERITISACSLHPLLLKFQIYLCNVFQVLHLWDVSLLSDVLKYYVDDKGCYITGVAFLQHV